MRDKKILNIWEHSGWGNSINWFDWDTRKIHGHLKYSNNLIVGDEIRSKMQSGNIGRFEVVEIKHMYNPSDQFFATLKDLGPLVNG